MRIYTFFFSIYFLAFVKEIIRELNRIGMVIDLSHSSDYTSTDVLMDSLAPAIFSHTAVRAICNFPANLPDDVIKLVVCHILRNY